MGLVAVWVWLGWRAVHLDGAVGTRRDSRKVRELKARVSWRMGRGCRQEAEKRSRMG